jgi:signal peptidase I
MGTPARHFPVSKQTDKIVRPAHYVFEHLMAKNKKSQSRDAYPKLPAAAAPKSDSPPASHAIRETIESIVIAFVLAFLFRTFEAEAFVIPTGSMAPTLMGAHKDVDCIKCGHRFRVNASEENGEDALGWRAQLQSGRVSPHEQQQLQVNLARSSCEAGMCPNCRYVNPFRPDLQIDEAELIDAGNVTTQKKWNGDRILVNKYIYTVSDPERWDVVVFKFPGNAQMNYIKRLVGLPGETIRVFQGDLFTTPPNLGPWEGKDREQADFTIARKPADVLMAMRQLVHDTNYDPVELYSAGWPLRWAPQDDNSSWQVEAEEEELTVRERYSVDASANETAWLRYQNLVPSYGDWRQVEDYTIAARNGPPDTVKPGSLARPQLVTDFNAYNTRVSDYDIRRHHDLEVDGSKLGLHWVGDLMVEASVDVEAAQGELILDLVEAGNHFSATIDLTTGRATLSAEGDTSYAPAADTSVSKPGNYKLAFANFDDQLRLWVNGKLIEFDADTDYDAMKVFGSREEIIPRTSDSDPGDLAPAGIGARGAKFVVDRLQVWRDIYYVAESWESTLRNEPPIDFAHPMDRELTLLPYTPSLWERYRERKSVEFPLGDDQFFVMGDNSPESSDARLWLSGDQAGGRPGGAYLERRLLIGKALCVYWPHSWNRIPGTPIPFPLFPNLEDMRLVR